VTSNSGDRCEEVRFVLNGPAPAGYHVEYGIAREPGRGNTGEAAGNATLVVVLNAPLQGVDDVDGHQPGGDPPQLDFGPDYFGGWRSLREVKHAGHFEGVSVLAVGVREELPFRVYIDQNDSYWTLVLQVAG